MRIESIRAIVGPNIYHRKSVLVMTLDLEKFAEVHSQDITGFVPRLLKVLPGLKEHRCSPGYVGGFVERLNRGTYFAHIVEHIALELSTQIPSMDVGYGKSIYGGREGLYKVIVRYKSQAGMTELLKIAVDIAQQVADGHKEIPDLEGRLKKIKYMVEDEALGPSTQAIVNAAEARNIPWTRLNTASLIQFGYGNQRKLIQATTTSSTGYIPVEIAQDKNLTKKLFERSGIRVPRGVLVRTEEEALRAFEDLRCAVAVKPVDAQQGKGISLNVTTKEQLISAFNIAAAVRKPILVEQFLRGRDYRVLVVNGTLVAASERSPAHVVGDGVSTIEQLIETENQNPLRGSHHEKPMTKIRMNDRLIEFISRDGKTLEDVPSEGERVYLCGTANLSTGGSAKDVTDLVHEEVRFLCERAARVVGLDVCGVDLMAEDISKSLDQEIGIVEVNASPGLRMHSYPSAGEPRDVGTAIINHLYPEGQTGRIPIIAITGTNGKTTVTRLAGHMICDSGKKVGMTSSDGVFICGKKVLSGDTSGPISAQAVLNDPFVEVAVLETARGGMVRRGLGFDQCDVAVITNVTEDHIGQDGIETVEDILKIKALIVEHLSPEGTVILNAEDPLLEKMARTQIDKRGREKVILFSLRAENEFLKEHRLAGGTAFFQDQGWVYCAKGGIETRLFAASDVPLTLLGKAQFQVANVLTVLAIGATQGLEAKDMFASIKNFKAGAHNQGRVNLFKVAKGYVICDYGHNPAAVAAMGTLAANWRGPVSCVMGLPGDRSDELMKKTAETASRYFDKIIFRDDTDRRGRAVGETPTMLKTAVEALSPQTICKVILDEHDAICTAIDEMVSGELVVVFYDNKAKFQNMVQKYQAVPVENFTEPKVTSLPAEVQRVNLPQKPMTPVIAIGSSRTDQPPTWRYQPQ